MKPENRYRCFLLAVTESVGSKEEQRKRGMNKIHRILDAAAHTIRIRRYRISRERSLIPRSLALANITAAFDLKYDAGDPYFYMRCTPREVKSR